MLLKEWLMKVGKKPEDWYKTNIIAQTNLYKLLKKNFIKKIIHVTTPEVYGNNTSTLKETTHFDPSTPYAISRAALDWHLLEHYKQFKLPVILTRTANVFGPTQDLYRIVPKTILNSLLKKKIYIDGAGDSYRSFIYIDDASAATYMICKKGKLGNTYHISTKKLISIKSLVTKIYSKNLKNFKKFIKHKKDRVGKDTVYNLSSYKLTSELNWKPKYSLDEGIKKTELWIKENFKDLSKKKAVYIHRK